MKFLKALGLNFVLFVLYSLSVFAQNSQVPMADVMRENGKIYVVVAVIAILFSGIVYWLFTTEKRLNRLEKNK